MAIGPINDIIVTITNVILKSEVGKKAIPTTETALAEFDQWQDDLIRWAEVIHSHWHDESHIADLALTAFEDKFKEIFN